MGAVQLMIQQGVTLFLVLHLTKCAKPFCRTPTTRFGEGAFGYCPRRHGQRNGARTSCPLWMPLSHSRAPMNIGRPKRTGCPRAEAAPSYAPSAICLNFVLAMFHKRSRTARTREPMSLSPGNQNVV